MKKYFDLFIQILIILSLISFAFQTIPDLQHLVVVLLYWLEIVVIFIFTIEYLFRVFTANYKIKFIFSFYGLIDLFAILPFYVTIGVDLRSIRIFRLIKLCRIFKMLRYNIAINRLKNAFNNIREELILIIIIITILLYISSIGIYYFENEVQPEQFKSVFHCLWWSVITLTTVGYGDSFPITIGGKIFTSFIALIGIGVIAIPTGLIASSLTDVIKKEK